MAVVAVLQALRALRPRTPAAVSAPVRSVLPAWRSSPVRTLQLSSALCAGHNKWSKVKNIKGPKDEARARMFMKFVMLIRIAVKGEHHNKHTFHLYPAVTLKCQEMCPNFGGYTQLFKAIPDFSGLCLLQTLRGNFQLFMLMLE